MLTLIRIVLLTAVLGVAIVSAVDIVARSMAAAMTLPSAPAEIRVEVVQKAAPGVRSVSARPGVE